PIRPGRIEVITYGNPIPYPGTPDVPLPPRPEIEVRGGGFLGLGMNPQDVGHMRRITEIYYTGMETSFIEQLSLGLELSGLKTAANAMEKAEEIVYALPEDSVAARVTADIAGDMAARMRARHARL